MTQHTVTIHSSHSNNMPCTCTYVYMYICTLIQYFDKKLLPGCNIITSDMYMYIYILYCIVGILMRIFSLIWWFLRKLPKFPTIIKLIMIQKYMLSTCIFQTKSHLLNSSRKTLNYWFGLIGDYKKRI